MINVLTVDVEDYHDQLALDFQDRIVPPDEEAVRATDRLLELFAEFEVQGTFFILGEIAEYFPELVVRIAKQGHHLGVHGYHHLHVFRQSPEQFRQSIDRAKKRIEDIAGRPADAHRATGFSINEKSGTMWALDILAELGFKYDSSIYPFRGRRYGMPTAPRFAYRHELSDGRWIWEVPPSTVVTFGRRWPVCGGGYLRLFPLWITDWAIRRLNAEKGAAVIYLHPYETELAPHIEPLSGLPFLKRCHFYFFNYQQLLRRKHTIPKLRYLLQRYPFGTIEQAVAEISPQTSERSGGRASSCW